MTEIEEKLLDILFTSNNPLIRLQWEWAKLKVKLPQVSKFMEVIEANFHKGIYTPIEISTVDDAFDAITELYKHKIDSNNQLTESEKELQKGQLTKNRERNKLLIKCFLLAVDLLVVDTYSQSKLHNQKDSEQYKAEIENRGREFLENFKEEIQSSLHQILPNASKDEIEQLSTSLSTLYR